MDHSQEITAAASTLVDQFKRGGIFACIFSHNWVSRAVLSDYIYKIWEYNDAVVCNAPWFAFLPNIVPTSFPTSGRLKLDCNNIPMDRK